VVSFMFLKDRLEFLKKVQSKKVIKSNNRITIFYRLIASAFSEPQKPVNS